MTKIKAPSKTVDVPSEGQRRRSRPAIFALIGPQLSAFKIITPDDKDEADVIWVVNMMEQLGTSQHNMCSCSVDERGRHAVREHVERRR